MRTIEAESIDVASSGGLGCNSDEASVMEVERRAGVKLPGLLTFLSPLLFIIGTAVFIWRLKNSHILEDISGSAFIYLFLLFLLAPMVLTIGWYGASMSFPIHKD